MTIDARRCRTHPEQVLDAITRDPGHGGTNLIKLFGVLPRATPAVVSRFSEERREHASKLMESIISAGRQLCELLVEQERHEQRRAAEKEEARRRDEQQRERELREQRDLKAAQRLIKAAKRAGVSIAD
jgi:hypothetical protein